MYKKTRKVFAVALVLTMLLTMTVFSGLASAATTTNRLQGSDRYATALSIVGSGWTTSDYAVLATGEGYADALAAAPLAKAYNAPILLVDPANTDAGIANRAAVVAKLSALGVKTAFIVGGTGVVSSAFEGQVTAANIAVTRLADTDRVGTSVKVAQQVVAKVGTISQVAVAYSDGYADALSIAPIAANLDMPILLTDTNSLPSAVSTFLAGKTITKTYVVGGTGVVSDTVKALLPNAVRLGGADRYATNAAVLAAFTGVDYSNIFLAYGENYPDALAGAAYAALENAPVVLVDGALSDSTLAFLADKASTSTKVTALGGTAVVPDAAVAGLTTAINNATFQVTDVTAINARQLLVSFNKAVLNDGTGTGYSADNKANYSIGGSNPTTAAVQADGKSVLLTMGANMSGTVLYIVSPVALAADTTVKTAIFTKVATYSDTVAPQVSSVTYPTYDKVKVTFTEPLQSLGTVSFTQDGNNVTSYMSVVSDNTAVDGTITYSLANPSIAADKPITATIVGAVDYANNLISPNPVTLTFTRTKTDTTSPTVTDIKALANNKVQVTFSEKLSANPTVTVGGNAVTFPTYDGTKDNLVFEGNFTPVSAGIYTVAVTSYTDMSGNAGLSYSRLAQFAVDTTSPTVVSTAVKTFSNHQYLVVNYSESVTPSTSALTVTGSRVQDYVTNPVTTTTAAPLAYNKVNGADVDNTSAIMIDITGWTNGAYTVTIPAGAAKDTSASQNASVSGSATFTKGDLTTTDTTAPKLATGFSWSTTTAIPVFAADNSSMTVVYNEDMDPATALNVANYKVGGSSIFSNAIFDSNAYTVKLTVIPGTISVTGVYAVSITNVKDEAGNAASFSGNQYVEENVKPYVTTAKLTTSSTITATFSENVSGISSGDFEVYVNGTKVDASVTSTTANTAVITLGTAIDDLSKTIQVKLVGTDVADSVGNAATTGVLVPVTLQ